MKYIIVSVSTGNFAPLFQIYEKNGDHYEPYVGSENAPTTKEEARHRLSLLEETKILGAEYRLTLGERRPAFAKGPCADCGTTKDVGPFTSVLLCGPCWQKRRTGG